MAETLLDRIKQHAQIPDAYSWAVLGISVRDARLLVAQHELHEQRIAALRDQLGDPKRCEDCGRTARELIAVQDPDGRITGWVGPTCKRRRDEKAERGAGVQLPLAERGPL
ncbi:MAG: hypothetical protein JWO11_4478 [Nocardioides sp.]|nr:hypothetical protein [Nocardioides sp.]